MEKQELIQLFEDYLNENGLWPSFKFWLENKEEKTPQDLGFSED